MRATEHLALGALCLTLVMARPLRAEAQGMPTVRFEPASLVLPPGDAALVEVVVDDIPDSGLAAFQLDIRFNGAVVRLANPNEAFRAAGIAPFAPLGGNPFCTIVRSTTTCLDPIWLLTSTGRTPLGTDLIDNDHGRVQVAYGTFGDSASPTGSGTIALLEVLAITADPARLSLANVILADGSEPPTTYPVRLRDAAVNGSVGDPGDANCDQRISAADLPALIRLLHRADPGPCGLADANQDGAVDANDVAALVGALFSATEPATNQASRLSRQIKPPIA